jgi:hypothetical protein
MDFVFFRVRPPGTDAEIFHPDPSNVWYGQCLLAFTFILRAMMVTDTNLSAFSLCLQKLCVCRNDLTPGQGLCLMWRCIVFQSRQTKLWSVAGSWLFKSESHRLYELDAQLPRLYVMPMTCLLGKISVVQAGNTVTVTIPSWYSMPGRAQATYPCEKCDSGEG